MTAVPKKKTKTEATPRSLALAPLLANIALSERDDTGEEKLGAASADFIKVLIVDDHPVVRKGLIICLSTRANLVVIGEASDGVEGLRKVDELRPDLVLMDVEMPNMDGLTTTEAICKGFTNIKVIILSMHCRPDYIVKAIQAGARGFVPKNLSGEDLVKAIDIVERGEPYFPSQIVSLAKPTAEQRSKDPERLFEREKEVVAYLAAGYRNREIAEILKISVRTVESHRARVMRKLNIHTTAGLTHYALAHGYISGSSSFEFPALVGGPSDPLTDRKPPV